MAPARSGPGSASTWRLTRTSSVTGRPANGLSAGKGASGRGSDQDSAPPSIRSPARRRAGTRSSVLAASLGPAKRRSTPPASIQASSWSRSSASRPLASAMTSSESGCSSSVDDRALADLGERAQRPLDEVELGQQRLVGGAARRADQTHAAAAPALVEQEDAGDALRRLQLDPGDAVAQVGRDLDCGRGSTGVGRHRHRHARHGLALGAHGQDLDVARRRCGNGRDLGGQVDSAGLAQAQRRSADRATSSARTCSGPSSRKASPSRSASAWPCGAQGDAVAEPDAARLLQARRLTQHLARGCPVDRPGARLPARQRLERGPGAHRAQLDPVVGAGGGLQDQHLAALALGLLQAGRGPRRCARSQCLAAAQPLSTTSSSGPLPPRRGAGFRTGPARADDQERRDDEAQQQEPPGRARRGPFRAQQLGQQQERREGDPPRRRRGDPQQQPQGRQGESRPAAARAGRRRTGRN